MQESSKFQFEIVFYAVTSQTYSVFVGFTLAQSIRVISLALRQIALLLAWLFCLLGGDLQRNQQQPLTNRAHQPRGLQRHLLLLLLSNLWPAQLAKKLPKNSPAQASKKYFHIFFHVVDYDAA